MTNKTDIIGKYIEQFQDILNRVGDDQVAVGILHEVSKDRRMNEIRAERAATWQARQQATQEAEQRTEGKAKQHPQEPVVEVAADDEPASDRQLRFLEDLGFSAPSRLSKAQASQLIGNIKAGRGSHQIAA